MNTVLTLDTVSREQTNEQVSYLVSHNIPAVLFCQPQNDEQKDVLTNAVKNGIELGNRLSTETVHEGMTVTEFDEQLRETHEWIQSIYNAANVAWDERYVRFPPSTYRSVSEHEKAEIRAILREYGYVGVDTRTVPDSYTETCDSINWGWTFNVREHSFRDEVSLTSRIMSHEYSLDKIEVIVLHGYETANQDEFRTLMMVFHAMGIDFVQPERIT